MIALLTGQLAHRCTDHIIVDVNGVGYLLHIPLSTFYTLPEEGRVRLQVFTHVKEDAITLYGFATSAERDLFCLLISVSGVGPKLATTILSHIAPNELALALNRGDLTRLTAIPGIGRKSAERLILELQDKSAPFSGGTVGDSSDSSPLPDNQQQDALSALVNLGYKETLAKSALKQLKLPPGTPFEQMLKAALQILQK